MLNSPPFPKKQAAPVEPQNDVTTDEDAIEEIPAEEDEQALRDELMKHAYGVMSDPKVFPNLEKMLSVDTANSMVQATLTIIERVERDKGKQDPELLLSLVEEIVPELDDLASDEGNGLPEEELEQVVGSVVGLWSRANPDRVDQEGLTNLGERTLGTLGKEAELSDQQQLGGNNGQAG
jgi:hypothetical protein